MKVLVAGANGHTGRLVIRYLKEKGHEPLALIRDEKQADALKELGALPVIGDLEQDVTDAVKQADAVIFAAGSGSKTGADKTIAVDQEGAKRLVDTAKKENIQHFVMLSSYNADDPNQGKGQGSMEIYYEAKRKADEHLKQSGLSYTIVRPGALLHEKKTGKIEAAAQIPDDQNIEISREDVATVLVESLTESNVKNKSFDLIKGDKSVEEALCTL
ncbi:SDR family oxidoreductase [Bacillus pumilus]|uniref:SDR family oxidoreductase n=1 Tax=Bacillus pumilus TaxID=1408 RepID=UPI001C24982A|nr:SDR family oxidoreductase [Bacillus pumilus]MBU8640029.1 SDR family oxidoreductase [Bacillus pumilus]